MWGLRNKLFLIVGIVMAIIGLVLNLIFMLLPIFLVMEVIGMFFIIFAIYGRTKYKGSKL